MIRCETCGKYSGEPSQPKVGEMVNFTIARDHGRTRKISGRTGKLMMIKDDGFSVLYRRSVYHVNAVSCVTDPSPLTLAFIGMCDCVPLENSHA